MKNSTQFLFLTILTLLSCNNDDEIQLDEELLRINHYETIAYGSFTGFYNLVQYENDFDTDNWSVFYSNIIGFDYEPGFVYEINVSKSKINNPPQDASSISYTLVEVISKEKVDDTTEFKVLLKKVFTESSESFVSGDIDSEFTIFNYSIECNDICNLLIEIQDETRLNNATGIFRHTNKTNTIELLNIIK